ncbi:MAG: hypothetical protein MHMPM18_000037 [Marteilia pararefringens]
MLVSSQFSVKHILVLEIQQKTLNLISPFHTCDFSVHMKFSAQLSESIELFEKYDNTCSLIMACIGQSEVICCKIISEKLQRLIGLYLTRCSIIFLMYFRLKIPKTRDM